MKTPTMTIDGNEACARVAFRASEVIAIYPITPSSAMGELADAWSAEGQANLWGDVPEVVEMQSEGGAAGAVHGAIQAGSLATTFTASQGLLLMIPNMYKIAGELTPCVIHVAARTLATHALSIFGDHSDVMAVRGTGFALLASASVQEAQDFALVAHAATLKTRIPFLHFFDGFRTSHEVQKIQLIDDELMRAMLDPALVRAHRDRALNPDRPVLRGTAQNPDVFFQAREAVNPFYDVVPDVVRSVFDDLARRTGRRYEPFEYFGAPDAERVLVLMGSGIGAAQEAVDILRRRGEKVGLLKVRLYRPFDARAFLSELPRSVKAVGVLDRTKEPGALGEPLFLDVTAALAEAQHDAGARRMPRVIGGRYGLSSKEFTPAMAAAVFAELDLPQPKTRSADASGDASATTDAWRAKARFTVGIVDDVTRLSLRTDPGFEPEGEGVYRAVFYGLGADGTVGANKNSVKIVGDATDRYVQGYFVYDSKKSGAVTVSHLRFSPAPIASSYLVREAQFVACHQFHFLERMDVLELAGRGATFLLNSPYGPEEVWDRLPYEVQESIIAKDLRFYVVDGDRIARETGMGRRINTVLQTAFFALSKVLPIDGAVAQIKDAIAKSYGKLGEEVLAKNYAAVDAALGGYAEVHVPAEATGSTRLRPPVPALAPDFVKRVTALMMAGKGELLPVSALPPDGTFPVDTAQWEKRSIALELPIWEPDICIDCALCSLVCPHAAIRMKVNESSAYAGAAAALPSKDGGGRDFAGLKLTIQVAPDDCTGCGVCVDVCPATSKADKTDRYAAGDRFHSGHHEDVASLRPRRKALNMRPKVEHLDLERARWEAFQFLPDFDLVGSRAAALGPDTVKGTQLREHYFEFSGACAGCGETPYVKLLAQLYGDRLLVANATGCSSIYGGNLPTTPWSTDCAGRGPAWSNSLFEDNAEFGLGIRLAIEARRRTASRLLRELAPELGDDFVGSILEARQDDDAGIAAQRERIAALKRRLTLVRSPLARELQGLADDFVDRSVWAVGGDGWAYDIGYGGLDHVLASGRRVKILVLDTEVYSNTGGQASKSTPRGAVAKFAASGKPTAKKDLGLIAATYGTVYVAQVAMGANPKQTITALREAESYDGPALVIAYSPCIAHGIDMAQGMTHQKDAVRSGYWPLWRYDPRRAAAGEPPFKLDSGKPTVALRDFLRLESRYAMLERSDPERANLLLDEAQRDVLDRRLHYEQLAGMAPGPRPAPEEGPTP